MKNRKYAMVLLLSAMMAMGSTGCGVGGNATDSAAAQTQENQQADEQGDAQEAEAEEREHEIVTVDSVRPESDTEDMTRGRSAKDEPSDDWMDMQFLLDGEFFQMPASYSDLEDMGWSFDIEDYGYEDGYMMNPGDETYSTIQLTNPDYEDLTLWVGFINTSDKAKDITECDLWSIELDTCIGFDQVDEYPDMEIAKGIGFGSSEEEVKEAFGKCDSIYESDYGYVVYSYEDDSYDFELDLTIDEDEGVTAIEMNVYDMSALGVNNEDDVDENDVDEDDVDVDEDEDDVDYDEDHDDEDDEDEHDTHHGSAKDELSDDWADMEFTLDGEFYQMPASYSDLEDNGWSFDLADYGHADGYLMNPGDMTYATIELTNPDYEDVTLWVGFVNTGSKAKDITECNIWSIEVDTCLGFDQVDEYPDMEIAQGIGIGSSLEEVEEAFGKCDDIYESDYDYVVYTYEEDNGDYELILTIDEKQGVTAIELNNYAL